MGISVLASYRGAQIFEAIGLSSKLVEKCFTGTSTQIEGVGFHEIAEESLRRHALAYGPSPADGAERKPAVLQNPGYYRFRPQGEAHAVTPPMIKNFHTFVQTEQAGGLQEIRRHARSTRNPSRCATCSNSSRPRPGRCRWRKSSPSRTSAAGSRRRACRWARSARRRTNASPSP